MTGKNGYRYLNIRPMSEDRTLNRLERNNVLYRGLCVRTNIFSTTVGTYTRKRSVVCHKLESLKLFVEFPVFFSSERSLIFHPK